MLAFEIANNGLKVRVNSIAPGVFPSEMTSSEESDMPRKNVIQKDKFEGKVPAGRPGNDRDFGNGVLFVATNQYLVSRGPADTMTLARRADLLPERSNHSDRWRLHPAARFCLMWP